MTLDRALAGVPFSVDLFRCHEAAKALSSYKPVHTPEMWSHESAAAQVAFKTLFISICHQMNWDVLQTAMAGWLLPNTDKRLEEFSNTTPNQIAELLAHYPKQERVRARERAAMLRATANSLRGMLGQGGSFARIIDTPILEGAQGYYSAIANISAFTGDPLEKKARVLAHDIHREHILNFADPQHLRPAVEYHLIRLYLRTGRVYPTHQDVRRQLVGKTRPTRDRLVKVLRQTVDEAMRSTAFYAGLDVATLNYVEWQLARSQCVAELGPNLIDRYCLSGMVDILPPDILALTPNRCAYAPACRSLNDRGYGWYHEPQFEKAIY